MYLWKWSSVRIHYILFIENQKEQIVILACILYWGAIGNSAGQRRAHWFWVASLLRVRNEETGLHMTIA